MWYLGAAIAGSWSSSRDTSNAFKASPPTSCLSYAIQSSSPMRTDWRSSSAAAILPWSLIQLEAQLYCCLFICSSAIWQCISLNSSKHRRARHLRRRWGLSPSSSKVSLMILFACEMYCCWVVLLKELSWMLFCSPYALGVQVLCQRVLKIFSFIKECHGSARWPHDHISIDRSSMK